jgi:DNA-binding response OmpR family regulator
LIVEDEVSIRDELSVLLNNAGHEAICVEDFAKAVDDFKSEQPDLLRV